MPLLQLNRVLLHLSPEDLRRVLWHARWRSVACRLPCTPLHLAVVHISVTMLVLFNSPPPAEIPPIFIPITWAASFATAIALLSLFRLVRT